MLAVRWRTHWRQMSMGTRTWSFNSHISNGVEWAHTLRPRREIPVLLRYETEDFWNGQGYQGALER